MASRTAVKTTAKEVSFGGIKLPRFSEPQHEDYLPEQEDYVDPHGYTKRIAWAWANDWDTLLLGPTGVGKTSIVRYMCALTNAAYRRFPCHEATDASTLLGKDRLGRMDENDTENSMFFQQGVVYDATINGHKLLLDDYNLAHPDVRMALAPLHKCDEGSLFVNENEGEVVPRHEDFRMVATGNPYTYAGVKEWNPAMLSRFDLVIEMEYLPNDVECDLLCRRVPDLEPSVATKMVEAVAATRSAYEDERVRYPVSTRELVRWGETSLEFGIGGAADMTIVAKCDHEDQETVREDLLASKFDTKAWDATP